MRTYTLLGMLASALLVTAEPAHAILTDAKTIIISDQSGGNFLALLEVEAISGATNVALGSNGAIATASSAGFGGAPADAIDGDKSFGCCGQLYHSNGANSVLVVTLPTPQSIDSINIFGRQGCCPERTDNIKITVLDSSNVPLFNQTVLGAGTASAGGAGVNVALPDASSTGSAIALQNATATFQQGNFGNVGQTIDGNSVTGGMGFFNNRTDNTIVAYETASDITGDGLLTFTIAQNEFSGHAIQRFRISVTDADRSLFADGLPASGTEGPSGDVFPNPGEFTLINPLSVVSINGATASVDANGIVTVSGFNPALDTFVVTAQSPISSVTGMRLEVLTGDDGFVGRSAGAPHNNNGNAVITEFSATFTPGGNRPAITTKELALVNPTATFDQGGAFAIATAADGIISGNNGWGVFGGQNQNQSAVFQTLGPVNAQRLVFELEHSSGFVAHKLEDFKLYFTRDSNPTATDGTINWIELTPDEATTSLAGTTALIDGNIVRILGSNASGDDYRIVVDGRIDGITGFRLEAIAGANGLIGFDGSNGNIVLSEFRVFATNPIPEPATATLLALSMGLFVRRRHVRN